MNETQLRAFVRGYWENADHETKKGEPQFPSMMRLILIDAGASSAALNDFILKLADFWYERGIKDLAEMVLAKIGEKE